MTDVSRSLATVLMLVAAGATPLTAQPAGPATPAPLQARVSVGSIQGTVSDMTGRAVEGALVSVLGAASAVAVTDTHGSFALQGLPPGTYLLRAHRSGFVASDREMVEMHPNGRLTRAIQLRRLPGPSHDAEVLAAGFAPGTVAPGQPVADDAAGGDGDHPHTPLTWRLRHVKRSALRDASGRAVDEATGDFEADIWSPGEWLGWAVESSARLATALFADFPLSGEINVLTTTLFGGGPPEFFNPRHPPLGTAAYVTLGAPVGSGDWNMKVAMSGGDLSTWILAGNYSARGPRTHAFDVGLSYGSQAFKGGSPVAAAAFNDGSRNAGAVYGFDHWTLTDQVQIDYGARWARYDYVDRKNLFSPRLGVAVSPMDRTFVRAVVWQRMIAPGAEEFMPPPAADLWLPPGRMFAPYAADRFRVERVRHVEVAVEREFQDAYVLGVRRFFQQSDDQLATLFGLAGARGGAADLGHYLVANAGSMAADGWGVRVSSPVARRLRGSVDYSRTRATWTPGVPRDNLSVVAPSVVRVDSEEFHDVTTSLEAAIPETSTRVHFVYRVNSAYAGTAEPGLAARFDLMVNQALPFRLVKSEWEVLVGLRNLFREPQEVGSVYDELLVVRPPKRIVTGFLVRF